MDNYLIINAPMGCKGHQVGRLLASCDNVLWYDHFKNGSQPWLPSYGLGKTFSRYHFNRRFEGAYGRGTDQYTVPPVLERAEAHNTDVHPEEQLLEWSKKVYPNNLLVVTHAKLTDSKKLFPNAKHLIVYPQNIDDVIERLKIVGADYRWSRNPQLTLQEAFTQDGQTFETSIKQFIQDIVTTYDLADSNDIVIHDAEDLCDPVIFADCCDKFNLDINYDNYEKVLNFVCGDNAKPQYETYRLFDKDFNIVEPFLQECEKKGFKNNNSLKTMKWDWCMQEGGAWFGTVKEGELISISGIHPFKDGYRALFRGAQTQPRPVKGLNKYQFQSWPFYSHLALQVEWARWQGSDKIYITTNVSNDDSGRMNRVHKSFASLEKRGIVTHCGIEEIFYTQQSVWQLNIDKYFEVRKIHENESS